MSGEVVGAYELRSGTTRHVGRDFKRARIRDGFVAVEPLNGTALLYVPLANIAALWSVAVTDLDFIEGHDD